MREDETPTPLDVLRALQWSANMLNYRQYCELLGWPEDDYSKNKFLEFQKLGRLHVFDDEHLTKMVERGLQGRAR